jgi:quercetin dioxygenase-like cupin family protein
MRVDGSHSVLTQVLDAVAASGDHGPRGLAAVAVEMQRGEMTPLHVHAEDEALRVLAGSVMVYVGDRYVRLAAGETYVAPRRVPHALAAGPTGARYVTATLTPAVDRYQEFVRAVALPALAGEGGALEEERALAFTAAASGIQVLGPPGRLPHVYVRAA